MTGLSPGRGAVVFDLDGTLIDSAPDIQQAANAVLAAEGLPPITAEETRRFIGNGAGVFVARIMAAAGRDPEPAAHARLLDGFLARYESAVHLTRVYPGVGGALAALQAAGHRLAICTNKPAGPARAVLAHLGLAPVFEAVVGGDSLPVRKPDPAPLLQAVGELGAIPAVYVGDSEVDAETAARAGLPFALYTEGYRKTPVDALPHDARFDSFAALPGLVDRLMPRTA